MSYTKNMGRVASARHRAIARDVYELGEAAPERAQPKVYEEIVDLIARGGNPREVIAFRPSEEAHARLDELLDREERSDLTAEERSELDHYLQLEHILRMAKARARQYLPST